MQQGKQQFGSVADGNGNGNAPVRFPSFKSSKPSFSDAGKHSVIGKDHTVQIHYHDKISEAY